MSRTRACGSCGTSNAATARECKSCGQVFGRYVPEEDKAGSDTRCAWTDHGLRCASDGTISDSTVGGGPWYCRRHNALRFGRPDPGYRLPPVRDLSGYGIRPEPDEINFADRARAYLREQMAQFAQQATNRRSKDWATRILERWTGGDAMPEISVRFACEALGMEYDEVKESRRKPAVHTLRFVHEPEEAA